MAEFPHSEARRAYVDFLARCDQAFTPFAPIDLPEFFAGRKSHLDRLQDAIDAPGRQVAIYGERGVGKTSLAKVAYFFLGKSENNTFVVRCQKESTFDEIFSAVLAQGGIEVVLNGIESEGEREGGLALGPIAGRRVSRTRTTFRRLSTERHIKPSLLLQHFAERDCLIIIDEYDRVQDKETHTRVAELIKHLSDARSKTKILLVGVADSLTQLLGQHESLGRSLAQIKLERMGNDELQDIIDRGEEHCKAVFKARIKQKIIRLSDGFPYFTHLLCRHACRRAGIALIGTPTATPVIAEDEYSSGLDDAILDAEHSLADQYEAATTSTRQQSNKCELVLWAIAISEATPIQIQDIAENIAFFTGDSPEKPSSFNYHLKQLMSEKKGGVLARIREGHYKLTNPLMRPYIRFILERENILTQGTQWEFPFMKGA